MEQNEWQLDRRKKTRFPMQRELRYKVLDGKTVVARGTGVTLDISSNGASFRSAEPLEPLKSGAFIELSISWPARLGDETPLRLAIVGKAVRSTGDWAACAIDRYEFRTQARVRAMPAAVHVGSGLALWAEIPHGRAVPAAQSWDRRPAHASR
jgi:hypothetical protein